MGANAHNDYADRKNGRKPVTPIHPELAEPLAEILGDTYGLIVYQEQVMAIAQKLAGYSLGKADLLRRAMGKKKKEILDKEYARFAPGHEGPRLLRRPRSRRSGTSCVPFSDYAFNKAHSAGYGAGLLLDGLPQGELPGRVHGRAAHLASATTRTRPPSTCDECRRMGIKVLPPDVNDSARDFAPVGTDIRFGLAADPQRRRERRRRRSWRPAQEKGAFTDFSDFLRKVDAVVCNKKVIESLIKAGCVRLAGPLPQGPAARCTPTRSTP